jgi:5'-methylthioadenosine phosphorylase
MKSMPNALVAIIGGSGFYNMEGLTDIEEVALSTPYGDTSDAIIIGTLEGTRVAFLPRHGRGHRKLPGELPQRANIFALKELGVGRIISVGAVGSLQESIKPLDIVVPNQIIDRTKGRPSTFFGEGIVGHIAFADPFCPSLSWLLASVSSGEGVSTHAGGTYIAMEGPAFSTRAESELYRSWGASVIGMTALPEAKLAREAEICYATMSCVTDYDCWHETEESVSSELILQNLLRNVEVSKQIVRSVIAQLPAGRDCECANALANAIITQPDDVPESVKTRMRPIFGRYMEPARRGS